MYIALLIVGAALFSLSTTYLWWTEVRVLRLRQDIFDKRDELFDKALELVSLDDPAYIKARARFNAIAWIAENLNIQFIVSLSANHGLITEEHLTAKSEEMQRAIHQAQSWLTKRLIRYLLDETATGWMAKRLFGMKSAVKLGYVPLSRFVESDAAEQLKRLNPDIRSGDRGRRVRLRAA